MTIAYVVFDKRAGRAVEPSTSITSYGRIAFNKGAAQQLVDKNFRRVLLMWDASNHKIGIKPVGKDEKDVRGYNVFRTERDNSVFIHTKAFLDWILYDYSQTRKYNFQWNGKKGMVEITVPRESIKANSKPIRKRAKKRSTP